GPSVIQTAFSLTKRFCKPPSNLIPCFDRLFTFKAYRLNLIFAYTKLWLLYEHKMPSEKTEYDLQSEPDK
ncbi:hypothetical protein, partial [Neisseria sp. HMSC056A03]|uniref:hypothetical protein n=1 Tax=Neisseria sp. HMSC056A03 TaxID=1739544 RepID=UPI001AEF3C90